MLRSIYQAKAKKIHFALVNAIFILLTLAMTYFYILVVWSYVGDGQYPKRWNLWINIGYLPFILIMLYPVTYYRMRVNYKKGKMSDAKSYLFAFGTILLAVGLIGYFGFF